ncbi:MAG: hypothetical protein HYU63_08360 [Armatimonadetes bacterium]|nr:hypothetical protein [Armatimonadota bacterium]
MGNFEIKGNNKDIIEKAFKRIENIYQMKYEKLKEKSASGKNLSPYEQEALDKMNTLRAKQKLSSKRFAQFKKANYLIDKSAKNIEEEKRPLAQLKRMLEYHYSSEHLKDSLKFGEKEAEGAGQSLYDLVDMNAKLIKGAGDLITNKDIRKDDLNPILLAISPLYYFAGKYSDDDVYAQMGERAKQIQGAINEAKGLKLTPQKVKELNRKYTLKLSLEEWKKMAENTQGFEGVANPNLTPRERFLETIKNLPLLIKLLPQALKDEAIKLYKSNNLEEWGTAAGYTLFMAGASVSTGPKNPKWNLSKFKAFPSAQIINTSVNSITPKEKILINLKKVVNKFPSVNFKTITPKPIPPKLNKDEQESKSAQISDIEEKERLQKWIGDRENSLKTEREDFFKQQKLQKEMEVNNYTASRGRKYVLGAPKEAEKKLPLKEEIKLPPDGSPTEERLRLDRSSIDKILDEKKIVERRMYRLDEVIYKDGKIIPEIENMPKAVGGGLSGDYHLWNLDTLNDLRRRIGKLESEYPTVNARELSNARIILELLLVNNLSSMPLDRVLKDLDDIEEIIKKFRLKTRQDLSISDDSYKELNYIEKTIKEFKEKSINAYVEEGGTKDIADKIRGLGKHEASGKLEEAPIAGYSSIEKITEQLAKDSNFSERLGELRGELYEDSNSGFTKKLREKMEREKLAYEVDLARSPADKLKLAQESAKPWVLRDLAVTENPNILRALLDNPHTPPDVKAFIQDKLNLDTGKYKKGTTFEVEELKRRLESFEGNLKSPPRDPDPNDPKIKELLEKFKSQDKSQNFVDGL